MKRILELKLFSRSHQFFVISIVSLMAVLGLVSCTFSASESSPLRPTSSMAPIATASFNSLDQILAAQQVRVAVSQDFPPFGSLDQAMQLQGYDVDVAKLLATELQVELKLIPVTSDRRIAALQADQVDMVIANLEADPQRAMSIYFSKAYAPFYSGIYGNPNVNAATYRELAAYKIGVTAGSLEDSELNFQLTEQFAIGSWAAGDIQSAKANF